MDHPALTNTGTIGWLLLITYSMILGCRAGHAPLAILSFFILSVLAADFWAIAPLQLDRELPGSQALLLLWGAATFPYLSLCYRFLRHLAKSGRRV